MRLGIVGYGNLGKSAEANISKFKDIELVGIFTRRNPTEVKTLITPVYGMKEILSFKDRIDVLFIAGGSANDLPLLTPELAENFNVIDSFDNHSKMAEHFAKVNEKALSSDHLALISAGWDPGVFSLGRILFDSFLPEGKTNTFWGRGVSQGHSNAIRKINGVSDARQYTVPKPEILNSIRNGEIKNYTAQEMHLRECFVVAEEGADRQSIENRIKTMPGYFAGYETTVNFISQEELNREHSGLPHGGGVIRNGKTAEASHKLELSLQLESNPEFTSSIILSYSRALFRLYSDGKRGCITVADVAPRYLFEGDYKELLSHYI